MKSLWKNLTTLLIFILLPSLVFGQENKKNFTTTLYGGLYLNNDYAWILEPSIAWQFHKLFGIAMGLEITSQYHQPGRLTIINGHDAELVNTDRNVGWVILKPSFIIKSPALWKSKDNDLRLWLQAEPGLSFACPFSNSLTYQIYEYQGNVGHIIEYQKFRNENLHWFYWNGRVSANFAVDRWIIGIGYYISNLDYYSGRRNVRLSNNHKFSVPAKELSQAIFVSLGYSF